MVRILVVEDEAPLRQEIVDTLVFESFDAMEAADGHEGLLLIQKQLPDLIICDIAMPNMNGYEFLLEVRSNPCTKLTPFVFLTARTDRSFVRHGMELGADDYLTKPFTRAELLAAINIRLARHHDVTEGQAHNLEAAKNTLVHMVAHELRTPLASMVMVQDIISRKMGELSPSQLQELLDVLSSGSGRLSHLIEQIVYLTELETGVLSRTAIEQNGQNVQIWQLLATAIELGRRFAYRHRDGAVRSVEYDREVAVLANTSTLKHALAELIANALNFSPEGSEITLSQWQANGNIWLSIVDQGAGMSEEQVERALHEFSQIEREKREQQGIGLGLPLARRIIEIHGGTLKLSSVTDKGTQVTISLPLVHDL